jgi:hypothetical protein
MANLEACVGGRVQGHAFDLTEYETACRAYDAAVSAEIALLAGEAPRQAPATPASPAPSGFGKVNAREWQ